MRDRRCRHRCWSSRSGSWIATSKPSTIASCRISPTRWKRRTPLISSAYWSRRTSLRSARSAPRWTCCRSTCSAWTTSSRAPISSPPCRPPSAASSKPRHAAAARPQGLDGRLVRYGARFPRRFGPRNRSEGARVAALRAPRNAPARGGNAQHPGTRGGTHGATQWGKQWKRRCGGSVLDHDRARSRRRPRFPPCR